ncbi:cytochrome c biogenesis protein CcdA [Brevibacterium sp. BDJS002]|uniref:cytochrome c biogenesis CcdA family protein n=1 Tax=Brevibacterium sp. BDJS002 TaxID=3020906 RepID=UPI002307FBE2|nr:cytochrome c biogenesis protein CcdA [Brevibacterium sp. BDJS002]MDN5759880.1 cytochrome c biogenesis protein CcdA [Tomitella sp.]WCE38949.1 cytochrome c biogenesis protein CcdA [Brevibacterium sp. BDJS002]
MGGLLALAFAAGMIAPVNPCGFALLPAWITHALGDAAASPAPVRLLRALRAGLALTIGFAGTLALAGVVVSAGARGLIQAAPVLGLAVGVLLVLFGGTMLAGRSFSLRLPSIPSNVTDRPPRTTRMVLFGVGYAAASLSCTFGVLLAVIAQAQATASLIGMLLVFAAYAAGSAAVLLLVAVAAAAAGSALSRRIAALARYGPKVTAAVLILTGAYLAWYWYPAATGDAPASGRSNAIAAVATSVSDWVQGHIGVVTGVSVAAVLVALLLGILAGRHRTSVRNAEGSCCDGEPARSAEDRPSASTE